MIEEEFGIELRGDKRLTLHTRVSRRLEILNLKSYREYYELIVSDTSREEMHNLASHITNNETYFFREKTQLNVFSEILKDIKKKKQTSKENKLKILSVGCSSGEEAYTINIILRESGLFAWGWDIQITGVDIDRRAISRAERACYTNYSFRGVNGNRNFIKKYFVTDGELYSLRKSVTKDVTFKQGNILFESTFEDIGGSDVIFCRNLFIYMNNDSIQRACGNFFNTLSDNGYLLLGSTESLIQKTNLFEPEYRHGIVIYRKNVTG
jgi:chemotaxis protein methyltransferase CheR